MEPNAFDESKLKGKSLSDIEREMIHAIREHIDTNRRYANNMEIMLNYWLKRRKETE